MPKKMKPVVVRAYSRARGANLLCLFTGGVEGANIATCHPDWYKLCAKRETGICLDFFPGGYMPRKRELAKLMKKPEAEITPDDMLNKTHEFEKRAFRRCRLVKIVATD